MSASTWQVFLSHNKNDAEFVRAVAARLQREQTTFWLDEANLKPGEPWQGAIQRCLPRCDACAVFLGPSGLGPWHELEIHAALNLQIGADRGFRVIPVLLPGASRDKAENVPLFLQQITWVEFNDLPDRDDAAWHRLRCGIEGKEPGFVPPPPRYLADADPRAKIVPRGLRSFDAKDHGWFLRLVAGPVERNLPRAIRFWKDRLEQVDPDETFRVGLLYGPSGCGKSSLMKAGLIPTLAGHVLPIYVEASAQDTEAAILRKLRKPLPLLPADRSLSQTLAALREQPALAAGRKVVLLLDQFEQWLHAHPAGPKGELADALRRCDGGQIQAVLMVRDEFFISVNRFLEDLEIRIREGDNFAKADLFDLDHARAVLTEYGRAFGRLPDAPAAPDASQQEFLTLVLDSLKTNDGKVVCVHLALVAELMKDRAWTPEQYHEMGGAKGIGLRFFKETFDSPSANPAHRAKRALAINVLKKLVPPEGTNIKGHSLSARDLARAAELPEDSSDFQGLQNVLDEELRLITPTDVDAESARPAAAAARDYQLTHDYLVPSLREWLSEKQRETARGRAVLCLEERAAQYRATPNFRFLPGPLEYLRILCFTWGTKRSVDKDKVLRAARNFYAVACSVVALLALAGVLIKGRVEAGQAATLVRSLPGIVPQGLTKAIEDLRPYSSPARPLLLAEFGRTNATLQARLNAAVTLAAFGDFSPLKQLTLRAPDPAARTAFIHGYSQWSSDPLGLPEWLQNQAAKPETNLLAADFRSAVCAAFALMDSNSLAPLKLAVLRSAMRQLYTNAPDAGTHSAAASALTRWGERQPEIVERTDQPAPGRDWFVNRIGMTLLRIPAERFLMGDRRDQDASPHWVTHSKSFFISDREVTVAQFRQFTNQVASDTNVSGTPDSPVQNVTWFDAVNFCNWLSGQERRTPCYSGSNATNWVCDFRANGYRLPTEAEWECACRAVSQSQFAFGDDERILGEYAWYSGNSQGRSWPTGAKLPNSWGLYDMHGNVWEWCWDWYDPKYYRRDTGPDPAGPPTGAYRVLRGGSWVEDAVVLRSAGRSGIPPGHRGVSIGFRCVVVDASSP